jgi:signal transduction histidine kinase
MTLALGIALAVGFSLAVVARVLASRGQEVEALAVLGLALAIVTPFPSTLLVIVLAGAAAAWTHRGRMRIEHDRERVASHLASVTQERATSQRGAVPVVDDPLARRALAALAERDLEDAKVAARARASLRPAGVRARFMAAMGHELRSPLNSIAGFAQLLEDGSEGPLNDAQRENVVLVRRAAEELITLLTDILDAARIEAGRVKLERQWIAPVEVLTLAIERARALPETERTTVDAVVQPGLSPLFVDRTRLSQALFNVLRAVARASGSTLRARVRETRERDRAVVRFEIHDPSTAIGDAEAARAFDPDPAARPKGRSLALGVALSVARDLAKLHGGDARAEPSDGGTSWIVWVPAEPGDAPPPKLVVRRPDPRARGSAR